MPIAKKSSRKKQKLGKLVGKHLRRKLHPFASWCTLGLVVACSFSLAGNAAAALNRSENNYVHQVFSQPIVHAGAKFSSSTAGFLRNRLSAPPCSPTASGTSCTLTRPKAMQNYGNYSLPQIGAAQFSLMQKNLKQFSQMLASLNSQAAALKKANIALPADFIQALATLNSDVSQIKNASSSENIKNIGGTLESDLQTVQQSAPGLSQLAQLPKLIKQAQSQINQAIKYYANYQKLAAKSQFELTQPLADYDSLVNQLQTALANVKTDMQTDPATATTTLQTDFYDNLNALQIKKIVLDISLTPRQGFAEANQLISQDQKQIKSLAKNGTDTTRLTTLVSQAKSQIVQIKSTAAATSTDAADVLNVIESLASTLQSINSSLPVPSVFTSAKPGSGFLPPPGFVISPAEMQAPLQPDQNSSASSSAPNQNPPTPPPAQDPSSVNPASGQDIPPPQPPPASIQ
jgi:hypothetical protein